MLKELIDSFEKLKKNIYVIDRGNLEPIIINFKDEHFYHLIGLHKLNLNMFFPSKMYSKAKRYKHMKNNIEKYDNIIKNQTKNKYLLELRISTFKYCFDMLNYNISNITLYNLKDKKPNGSRYDGDYGLLCILEEIYCLLGLKEDIDDGFFYPQSWMASNRPNRLTSNKPPKYFKKIAAIPKEIYNKDNLYAL